MLTFAVLLKPLSEEFSWSREAVSSAFAAMTVSIAVSAPVVGLLAVDSGQGRSLGTLTGVVWMAFGVAGAVGPVLMGRAFDATGSYEHVLIAMAVGVLAAAALMLTLPSYQPRSGGVASVA